MVHRPRVCPCPAESGLQHRARGALATSPRFHTRAHTHTHVGALGIHGPCATSGGVQEEAIQILEQAPDLMFKEPFASKYLSSICLGPPVVPCYPFFGGGFFDKNWLQKKVATLILTSLLEDLAEMDMFEFPLLGFNRKSITTARRAATLAADSRRFPRQAQCKQVESKLKELMKKWFRPEPGIGGRGCQSHRIS